PDSVLIQYSHRNNLRFRRSKRDQSGHVCAVTKWASSLVADLARIRIIVNEIKTRQQVSRQRWVSYINSCIQHRDTHRLSIAKSAAIYRVSLCEMNRLRRPLRGVVRRSADTPTIANTPAVTAALRRFLDKVRLRKQDTTVV